MNRILVTIEEEIKKTFPKTLIKDLQEHERICPTCNGLGMIAVNRPYGIKGDTSEEAKGKHFPYNHQTLSFCPNCFNGVQNLCQYCGKPITKGHIRQCDCKDYLAEEELKRIEKWRETIAKAKEVSEKDVNTMLYCDENDKYFSSVDDFLDEWESYHEEDELKPLRLWVTSTVELSFNASNILESACEDLHEEASNNCDYDELQKILDEYASKQSGTKTYYPCYEEYVLVSE